MHSCPSLCAWYGKGLDLVGGSVSPPWQCGYLQCFAKEMWNGGPGKYLLVNGALLYTLPREHQYWVCREVRPEQKETSQGDMLTMGHSTGGITWAALSSWITSEMCLGSFCSMHMCCLLASPLVYWWVLFTIIAFAGLSLWSVLPFLSVCKHLKWFLFLCCSCYTKAFLWDMGLTEVFSFNTWPFF